MSSDRPDSLSTPESAGQPRQRAHTPNRASILERLAQPARAAVLATLGIGLGLLSVAYNQQVPQASAIAVPTPAPAGVEQVASPVAALAYAEVSTPTPAAAHVEAAPAAIDTASAAIDAASIEAVAPSSDEPTVNPDELLGDLRPQLSARGGRRTDESTLAAEQATPAPVQLEYAMTTSSGTLAAPAVKTATPQPVVKTPTKTPTPRPATTTSSALGQQVVSIAMRYIGYRYSYGGTSPSTGFDCSGFAYYVYKTAGHPISRDLGVQYNTGAWVSRSSLMPGDLVFFKNTWGYGLSHVAIYIGSGRFVHSRSEGYGVTTNSFDTYWSSHYLGARRP